MVRVGGRVSIVCCIVKQTCVRRVLDRAGRRNWVAVTAALHSEILKPRSGDPVPRLMVFVTFRSYSRQMQWEYFKLGSDRFLPYHIQIIILSHIIWKPETLTVSLNKPETSKWLTALGDFYFILAVCRMYNRVHFNLSWRLTNWYGGSYCFLDMKFLY